MYFKSFFNIQWIDILTHVCRYIYACYTFMCTRGYVLHIDVCMYGTSAHLLVCSFVCQCVHVCVCACTLCILRHSSVCRSSAVLCTLLHSRLHPFNSDFDICLLVILSQCCLHKNIFLVKINILGDERSSEMILWYVRLFSSCQSSSYVYILLFFQLLILKLNTSYCFPSC